jgi:hypothetical protein
MLGIVFAQCWIHSLSPFAYWSKGTFGLRAAEGIVAATAGIYGAITSSCSIQKGYWLLSLSLKRMKAGMK